MADRTEAEDRDGEEAAPDDQTRPDGESADERHDEESTYVEERHDEESTDVDERHDEESTDVDAMGNDKRRVVVGGQYGATMQKKLLVYGVVLAVMVGIVVAFLTVVTGVDNKEIALKDTAPWTEEGASQEAPRDVDYKANGPNDTIPVDEINNR